MAKRLLKFDIEHSMILRRFDILIRQRYALVSHYTKLLRKKLLTIEKQKKLIMTGGDLKELRKKNNYTQAELSDLLGITSRTLQLWEYKEDNKLPPRSVNMIEKALPDLFSTQGNKIPMYDITSNTTGLISFEENMENIKYYIDFQPFNDVCTSCIPVIGDSMTPEYRNGDYIGLARAPTTHWGYGEVHFLITREGHGMIKVIKKHEDNDYLIMRSFNPEYDDFKMLKSDIIHLYLVKAEFKRKHY